LVVVGSLFGAERRLALGLRERFLGLQRVVDNDDVGIPPGQKTTDRGLLKTDKPTQAVRFELSKMTQTGLTEISQSQTLKIISSRQGTRAQIQVVVTFAQKPLASA
jgi:hypothetical protein